MSDVSTTRLRALLVSQYFIYFGVLGIYLPFFNLYCYHIGFSGTQIGAISAVRTLATALFPMIWGHLADRFHARKPIYIACSFASVTIWALFLLTTEFWLMMLIMVAYGIFYAPIISFLEAFTMDFLGSRRREYGRLRVWGSISFICVVLAAGRIVDAASLKIILVLILAGSLLQAALSVRIRMGEGSPVWTPTTEGVRLLATPPVAGFLVAAMLMLASHGAYYAFFSIHLESLGYGSALIGICWALAVAAEVLVMILSPRLFHRVSLQSVLVFSCVAAAIRWFALAATASLPVIFATQLLHAFSYGTFHMASILRIDELMPAGSKTLGQAANNAVTYGLGMMVGFFGSGLLYEAAGSPVLFVVSGVAAAAGCGVMVWFRPRPEAR